MLTAARAAPLAGSCTKHLGRLPIRKYDMRRPGATKPAWRWRRGDLLAFQRTRMVEPGRSRPMMSEEVARG